MDFTQYVIAGIGGSAIVIAAVLNSSATRAATKKRSTASGDATQSMEYKVAHHHGVPHSQFRAQIEANGELAAKVAKLSGRIRSLVVLLIASIIVSAYLTVIGHSGGRQSPPRAEASPSPSSATPQLSGISLNAWDQKVPLTRYAEELGIATSAQPITTKGGAVLDLTLERPGQVSVYIRSYRNWRDLAAVNPRLLIGQQGGQGERLEFDAKRPDGFWHYNGRRGVYLRYTLTKPGSRVPYAGRLWLEQDLRLDIIGASWKWNPSDPDPWKIGEYLFKSHGYTLS